MITFSDFVDRLPTLSSPPSLVQTAAAWATYVLHSNPLFLPPALGEESPIVSEHTAIVVVSAAGAVGKTTLAREIAYYTHAPMLDLSRRTVGSDTFLGLIGNAFGPQKVSNVFQGLQTGNFLLLFDALDETRVGSGEANFTDFLDDIVRYMTAKPKRPTLLLFARVGTAELVEEWLKENGVGCAHYKIVPFDEDAAAKFVEKRLDLLCEQEGTPAFHHEGIFPRVRAALFDLIRSAAGYGTESSEGEEFLGYAPVLVAVAQYLFELRDKNYRTIQNQLESYRDLKLPPSELLRRIVTAVLEREQKEKFLPQLGDVFTTSLSADRLLTLYSPDEQCGHLLYRHFLGARTGPLPNVVPAALRDRYEKMVAGQLEDHPFRRGGDFTHIVFRDYVYAWLLSRPDGGGDLGPTARQRLLEENFLPSPLLARFMLALSPTPHPPRLRARDIGFLYESVLSGARGPDDIRLTLRSTDKAGDLTGLIVDEGAKERYEFRLAALQEGLWLWRRLLRADVRVDCGLELGAAQRDFSIGPAVGIECDTFTCTAANLWVVAPTDEDIVVIEARTNIGASQPRIGGHRDRLFVRWEPLSYPWAERRLRSSSLDAASSAVMESFAHLRRILLWFRAEGYSEIARHVDLVNKVAPGGTPGARQMLQFCRERGLIRAEGPLYSLDLKRLSEWGIHWDELRKGELGPEVRRLIGEFLTWRNRQEAAP